METISIDDIREQLAKDDAEGLDSNSLFEIMLCGCTGYNNYSDEECMEWYLNKGHLWNDEITPETPEKIAIVLGSDGKPKFEVFQQYQDVSFESL